MAVTKVNAENWTFEVSDGGGGWTNIAGIEDFDVSPNTTRSDTSDFDSEGVEEHRVIRRGKGFTVNGHWLEDEADGSRDAGQDKLKTLADAVGSAAQEQFRLTSPGGTTETFDATVEESPSGDKNDVTKFSYDIQRTGASVFA